MMKAKPEWLRKRLPLDSSISEIEVRLGKNNLHTVCQEALCPNQGECFAKGVATFLIMGNTCTRNCLFCAVHKGIPSPLDPAEPERIADQIREMGLKYVVVTSVTRDDLVDGGAGHFAKVVKEIRKKISSVLIELLIPDFLDSKSALEKVIKSAPDVLNHNIETVPRLYSVVRSQANYMRSVNVLRQAKRLNPELITKSGIMIGMGETFSEVREIMKDLREARCDIITIGQYLRPSGQHYPVQEYCAPGVFENYKQMALDLGFKDVIAGTFVRSSYRAEQSYNKILSY